MGMGGGNPPGGYGGGFGQRFGQMFGGGFGGQPSQPSGFAAAMPGLPRYRTPGGQPSGPAPQGGLGAAMPGLGGRIAAPSFMGRQPGPAAMGRPQGMAGQFGQMAGGLLGGGGQPVSFGRPAMGPGMAVANALRRWR